MIAQVLYILMQYSQKFSRKTVILELNFLALCEDQFEKVKMQNFLEKNV